MPSRLHAAPFTGIVFRNVDVEAGVECINADVKIETGPLSRKKLSSKALKERIADIEACKKLLH